MTTSREATPLRGDADAATPLSRTPSRRRLTVPSARRVASVTYPVASSMSRVRHGIGGATRPLAVSTASAGSAATSPMAAAALRLFHPAAGNAADQPLPVVVFFHGGGFAYLSAFSPAYDAACRRIARYAGAAVLSVEYRRSPEHRYPAAYDDGLAALRFLDDPANLLTGDADAPPLDPSRCFLAGDSAGGNIAHHVARRYALESPSTFARVRLRGLIAIQPFFGGEERTPAELRLDGAPIVSVPRTDWMWRAFLPAGADRSTHEACAPAAAVGGLRGAAAFPPATVVVGGYDPLQDWQRRYCDALRGEGKEVRVVEYPDAIHAFYVFPEFPEAKDLMLRIKEIVAAAGTE